MRHTLVILLFGLVAALCAQGPRNRVIGVVVEVDAKGGVVKTDAGESIAFGLQPETRIQRVAPGEKDLSKAQPIHVSEISAGDRVLVRGTAAEGNAGLIAQSVVVMSSSDIAQKQQKERMEWQRRGVGGLVVSTDAIAKEIKIKIPSLLGGEATAVTVALKENTALRRYAPDSVKFSEAKPSTLADIRQGDQLRALGDKSEDGTRLVAEEIVTGTFRTLAATVTSVNPEAGEVLVKEMGTNKPLTVKVTADSNLRKMFSFGGGPGGPGAGGPESSGGPARATMAGGAPGGGMMGGGRRPDVSQMLERLPKTTLAEVKPGETVIVASTVGASANRLTAITLLSNADVIIAMQQRRQQQNGGRSQGAGPGMGGWNMGDMSMIPMQ